MKKLVMLALVFVLCFTAMSAMAADPTDVVNISGNITLTEDMNWDKVRFMNGGSYTLDLAGHTLTLTKPIWVLGGTLTVKNSGNGGRIFSTTDAFVVGRYYTNGTTPLDKAASLKIEAGVTVEVNGENCNCVYLYGTKEHKASLVTAGNLSSLYKNGDPCDNQGAAIQGNGNAGSGSVTVTGGRVYSANDVAIYHPQKDNLTITGGEIIGNVGIEIRSGELVISGNPTIVSHSTKKPKATANGNGSTAQNAAIAVSPHTNVGDSTLKVNISGEPEIIANGEAAAIYAVKTEKNGNVEGAPKDSKISISMNGGHVYGPIISEDQWNPNSDKMISISIVETFIPVDLPETGDKENLMMWVALLAMACAGLAATRKMSRV